jgi:hypothetical protein
MFEPKIDRDPASLHGSVRGRFHRWKTQVEAQFPQFTVKVIETRRSEARQRWLYAQGRTRKGKIVTWTMDSRHRWGLALDFVLVRNVSGRIDWDAKTYERVLAKVPPDLYQLKSLASIGDYGHLEASDADYLISVGRPLGVKAA